MASTENAVARKLASHRQLNGFRPIPIDASVILLFLSDVEGGDQSPCAAMVRRAMEFKGRSINFFVTSYYADDNGDSRADRIGWQKSEGDKSFRAMDTNYIESYRKGLAQCMRVAVDNNFKVVVHIHLDDGIMKGTWRNVMIFNPIQKYGAFSYYDSVLKPTAEAVKMANYKGGEVYFAMQAEMGATLFYYPKEWRSLIGPVKATIGGNTKVGVNVNWEKICGCPSNLIYSTQYYTDLKNNWGRVQSEVDVPAVRELFKSVDWIGVSAYAGLPRFPSVADLETSLKLVDQEMKMFGMDLKGLGKEIIYSEYGLGGGMTGDYKTPAASAFNVASSPYWGVEGGYQSALDPWKLADNRQFMQNYYQLTTQYAQRGGVEYPVSAIYMWNIISYDVLGVHYMSSSNQGSYRDNQVAGMIAGHNAAVRG
jgi:hypothetical protein